MYKTLVAINHDVKVILIFVISLTIAVLLFIKVGDFKEATALNEVKAEYESYTSKKIEDGSFLDEAQLQSLIEENFDSFLIEEESFKNYLAPEGYSFNLQNLSRKTVKNKEGEESLFTVSAGIYGPVETADWKDAFNTPIIKNASESLIASSALRSLREWETHLDLLNDTVYDLSKKNKDVGLGFSKFRSLSAKEKDAIYKKMEDYYKANCSYGRLQLSKSKNSEPYDIALDLISLQNIIFSEATQEDEVKFVFRLENILLSYLDHLRTHDPSIVLIEKIQQKLADYSKLDTYFFNNFNLFRSTYQKDIEARFDLFTRQRRLSDNYLDETFILTERMRYRGQFLVYSAAEKIAVNSSKGTFYNDFDPKCYADFKEYVEKEFFQKEDDEIYIEQLLSVLNIISEKVHDYAKVRLKRDKMSILMAAERYRSRTGEYPKSLLEISGYDHPYDIINIITGKPYEEVISRATIPTPDVTPDADTEADTDTDEKMSKKSYDLQLTLGSDHVLK